MRFFDQFLAIGYGDHSFPQPKSQHCASATEVDSNTVCVEAGFVSAYCAKSRSFARIFSILTLVALLSSAAFAQTGGKISGEIKDATGAVIPGSEVVLLNPATGVKRSSVTGADGVFNFPILPLQKLDASFWFNAWCRRHMRGLNSSANTIQKRPSGANTCRRAIHSQHQCRGLSHSHGKPMNTEQQVLRGRHSSLISIVSIFLLALSKCLVGFPGIFSRL
jgi:hypothetical protein